MGGILRVYYLLRCVSSRVPPLLDPVQLFICEVGRPMALIRLWRVDGEKKKTIDRLFPATSTNRCGADLSYKLEHLLLFKTKR